MPGGVTKIASVFRAVHIGSLDYSYRAVMADNGVGPAALWTELCGAGSGWWCSRNHHKRSTNSSDAH